MMSFSPFNLTPARFSATEWPDVYRGLCFTALEHGEERSPRGQQTRELRDVAFTLVHDQEEVNALIPIGINRGVNPKLAAIEALQLCLGIELTEMVHELVPALSPFAEDDSRKFWGAYGARAGGQVLDVIAKLKADRDTRQAVMQLWDKDLDAKGGKKDHPCTLALVFSIVDDYLDLSVTMRSNDVWLGTAYDVFQFTQLQFTVARLLNLPAGQYTHHAVSFHLYERDVEKVERLTRWDGATWIEPTGFSPPLRDHGALKMHAASILWPGDHAAQLTPSERWYREQLT